MNLIDVTSALCAQSDPEVWFPEPGGGNGYAAKKICAACAVREACLKEAMTFERGLGAESRSGIWGGLTGTQRAKLAKGELVDTRDLCRNGHDVSKLGRYSNGSCAACNRESSAAGYLRRKNEAKA